MVGVRKIHFVPIYLDVIERERERELQVRFSEIDLTSTSANSKLAVWKKLYGLEHDQH